jgi:hypothetical protein
MQTLPLSVFDVNETLLDLEVMSPIFKGIFRENSAMREWFANLILYSEALTLAQSYIPFTEIGAAAMKMLADTRGIQITEADKRALTDHFSTMPAHPEVPGALRRLRQVGFRLFTLTDNLLEVRRRQNVDLFCAWLPESSWVTGREYHGRYFVLTGAARRGFRSGVGPARLMGFHAAAACRIRQWTSRVVSLHRQVAALGENPVVGAIGPRQIVRPGSGAGRMASFVRIGGYSVAGHYDRDSLIKGWRSHARRRGGECRAPNHVWQLRRIQTTN